AIETLLHRSTPVLQVPAQALLEGDAVTLRCRVMQKESVLEVRFYHDGKDLGRYFRRTELFLHPLQLNHSGRYHYNVRGSSWPEWSLWAQPEPVTVTVHGEHSTPHT
ncbi:FCGR2 protein, partial [Chloropsis hardwickii]|nr:FCGR2 protein [Chloropsis hardwickii]